MIDGEGSVSNRRHRRIRVTNIERELITACEECCEILGIKYWTNDGSRITSGGHHVYEITMTGLANMQRIQDVVPLRSRSKQHRLAEACQARPRSNPGDGISRIELDALYTNLRCTAQELARHYGVTPRVVAVWLDKYGIRRRGRGEANRLREEMRQR